MRVPIEPKISQRIWHVPTIIMMFWMYVCPLMNYEAFQNKSWTKVTTHDTHMVHTVLLIYIKVKNIWAMSPAALSMRNKNDIDEFPGYLERLICIISNQFDPRLSDAEICHETISLFSKAIRSAVNFKNVFHNVFCICVFRNINIEKLLNANFNNITPSSNWTDVVFQSYCSNHT